MSKPCRFIYNDDDMDSFIKSPAKKELLLFTETMGKSCASKTCTFRYDVLRPLHGISPAMAALHGALSSMKQWIEEIPPDSGMCRFGNPAFRVWHERLTKRSQSIIFTVLSITQHVPGTGKFTIDKLEEYAEMGQRAAIVQKATQPQDVAVSASLVCELSCYIEASFGHPVRLDYGTGHECSFQVLMLSLYKLGSFGSTEEATVARLKATTLSIWSAYLSLTRMIQTRYMLEPAGSHGVWGLDDYHCLPFYLGACQMQSDGRDITPDAIHSTERLDSKGESLLYLGCVQFIKSIKRGAPFYECSPMLHDISRIPSWMKISSGLIKLFEGEVLNRRQVVQHFVFGDVFEANWVPSKACPLEAPSSTFRT